MKRLGVIFLALLLSTAILLPRIVEFHFIVHDEEHLEDSDCNFCDHLVVIESLNKSIEPLYFSTTEISIVPYVRIEFPISSITLEHILVPKSYLNKPPPVSYMI